MTKFEELLNETETLEEALDLQPCLEDGLSDLEVEKIRLDFLEDWYNISIYEYMFLTAARARKKAQNFASATATQSPSDVISTCI